jgi:hypothetical protein
MKKAPVKGWPGKDASLVGKKGLTITMFININQESGLFICFMRIRQDSILFSGDEFVI